MKKIECNKEGGYILNLEKGTRHYEDKEGNIYQDREEYIRESRDKKINDLLNG